MVAEEEYILPLLLVGAAPATRERGRVRVVVAAPRRNVGASVGVWSHGTAGVERGRKHAELVNKTMRGSGRHGGSDGKAFMKTTRGGNSLSCDRRGFGMRRSRRVGHGKKSVLSSHGRVTGVLGGGWESGSGGREDGRDGGGGRWR